MIGTHRPYLTESNILKLAWAAQQVVLTRDKTDRDSENSKSHFLLVFFRLNLGCLSRNQGSGSMIGTYRPYLTESNMLKLAWAAQQIILTRDKTSRDSESPKSLLQHRYNENYIGNEPKSQMTDLETTDGT